MAAWVLHVDLDQFIAAVEVLRRPELRGLPVVVGGDGDPTKRGVVSTASYEARAHGVHSGLPLRTASRRCPQAVFVGVDKPAYDAASAEVMGVLRGLGVVVQVLGWDEAFLAVDTDDPETFARDIQRRVREATALVCSVGIGQNRLQAKLATDFGKPAGMFRLTDDNWYDVLGDLSTDALWGIGRKTARKLTEVGIGSVRQLAAADRQAMAAAFGPATGPWLIRLAQGRDRTPVVGTPYVARSRSRETTFQTNLGDWEHVRREVAVLARRVADDVVAEQRPAARIVVKVRHAPFFTSTRGVALEQPTDDLGLIELAALTALDRFEDHRPVRLLGVRAEFAR